MVNAAATVPWKEALDSGKERVIVFRDFLKASSGEDAVTPSLPAWYGSVKKKLIEDEENEEDEKYKHGFFRGVFMEVISLETPESQSPSGGSKGQTVKHKKEQEELLNEEERRLFNHLIKDIEKRTDESYKIMRRMRIMFSRYVV